MKRTFTRLLSGVMALAMVMSMLIILPMAVSAEDGTETPTKPSNPLEERYGIYVTDQGVDTTGMEVWDGTVTTTALTGEGTESSPYLITSPSDFIYFRDTLPADGAVAAEDTVAGATSDTYFKITNDLCFNDAKFSKTANYLASPTGTFAGVLDGNCKTIYNVHSALSDKAFIKDTWALFDTVSGTVKNLDVAGLYAFTYTQSAGGVALNLSGRIENVSVAAASFHISNGSSGGFQFAVLATHTNGGAVIKNCSVAGLVDHGLSAKLKDDAAAGGITAQCLNATADAPILIENCTSYATIQTNGTRNAAYVGGGAGIVGVISSNYTTVRDSVNYGTVYAKGAVSCGGVVGSSVAGGANTLILNCYNYGTIESISSHMGVGGVVGAVKHPTFISDCVNEGAVTATASTRGVGGIVGDVNAGEAAAFAFDGCINRGAVTGTAGVGGIVGEVFDKGRNALTIRDCANEGLIMGESNVGGILGEAGYSASNKGPRLEFYNIANTGDVVATVSAAGGLIGYFKAGALSTTYWAHRIYVFGFVNTATVSAPTVVGGLIGKVDKGACTGALVYNLNYLWLGGTIEATAADGVTALLFASTTSTVDPSITLKESGFGMTVKENGTTVETPACYVNASGADVAVDHVTVSADAFTNGTAVKSLNTYALTKGYAAWVQGDLAPEFLSFSGATMTLGGSMALNMKLATAALNEIQALVNENAAFADKTIAVAVVDHVNTSVETVLGEQYYTATFDAIRAADMATTIYTSVVLTVNGVTCKSPSIAYSPATYLTNLYKKNSGDSSAEAQSITDVTVQMMNYGVAAEAAAKQVPVKGTNAYAVAAAAGMTLPTDFTYTQDQYTVSGVMTQADKDLVNAHATTGVGATLTGGITLSLNGMTPGDTVTVSFRDVSETYTAGDDGIIVIDMIHAGLILDTITLTFTDGVAKIALGNYLDARMANANETALAQATINYMMAVHAYMLIH